MSARSAGASVRLVPDSERVREQCVAALEDALGRARGGEMTAFALVTVSPDGRIRCVSDFERRLELLGALSLAALDASNG